jgi:hypothetical protein
MAVVTFSVATLFLVTLSPMNLSLANLLLTTLSPVTQSVAALNANDSRTNYQNTP